MIEKYWGWAHKVAAAYVQPSDERYDDLVQEALIKAWQVLEAKDDPSAVYVTKSAKYRMQQVLQGKQPLGGNTKPGPKSRPKVIHVDWSESEDLEPAYEVAYSDDVLDTLRQLALEDAEYVFRRFWQQSKDAEIGDDMGVSRKTLHARWTRRIRPQLEALLVT